MENKLVQTNAVKNLNFATFFRESLRKLSDEQYFESLPAGYRFKPTHDELIVHYLMKRIKNQELPRNKIKIVNLYEFNPETLAEKYRNCGENEWFFFTSRLKKYKNGKRPDRAAGDGYWKASGADTVIKHNGVDVGSRKTLVFYEGKPPSAKNDNKNKKETKTSWIMHEYTVINPPPVQEQTANGMKLDDWVLCRIRKNENKKRKRDDDDDDDDDGIQEPDKKTDEVPCHQEDKHTEGKDSAIVAPEELLPYNKSEIEMADSFLNDNDNQNILTNADNVHNTQSIPQHQNAFTYYNPVHVPNVQPPNHSNGGYVYGGFPVRYVADVKGEQHQELPGISEMDLREYYHELVPDGDQENPGLDDTDDSLEDSDTFF